MTHSKTWIIAMAFTVGLALSFSLGAAAQEEPTDDHKADVTDNTGKTCFWIRQINGWQSIDNRHVYVSGGGKREKFLLTLFNRCYGVRFAENIALKSRPTSRLCSNGNERLFVLDRIRTEHSCLISDVERVADYKAAKQLVSERKAAKVQEKLKQSESEAADDSASLIKDGEAFASK